MSTEMVETTFGLSSGLDRVTVWPQLCLCLLPPPNPNPAQRRTPAGGEATSGLEFSGQQMRALPVQELPGYRMAPGLSPRAVVFRGRRVILLVLRTQTILAPVPGHGAEQFRWRLRTTASLLQGFGA